MGVIRQLQDAEPFKQLPPETFELLRSHAKVRRFPAHVHIFNQHAPATGSIYIVKQGAVEIVALTPGGVEMVVDVRHEGDSFGGTPIFTGDPYTAGARTLVDTECYLIPAQDLLAVAEAHPQVRDYFTRVVLSRVRNLYAEMVGEHGRQTADQMEHYPFKKRLSEIMSTPVVTCSPDVSLREVARTMRQRNIGALPVEDVYGSVVGIITERDLVTKFLAQDALACDDATAADVMEHAPECMSPETLLYEAITFMMEHGIKYLPVVDGEHLEGIVALTDLLRFRSQKSMLLLAAIKDAVAIADLARIKRDVVKVAVALMGETRSHFETMEILSYLHHRILQRGYDMVLDEMRAKGMEPPPIRFCLMVMGSGGRKEMLLNPDQDNGLIFENFPDEMLPEVEAFMVPFADRLVEAYAEIGYPLCNGKVMINNPLWRGRLSEWEERVDDWVRVPEPKKVMYSTIFLDFMPLVGDPTLCQDLRDVVHEVVRRNPRFMYHLLENDLNLKLPLGLLGRLSLEKSGEHKGKISVKQAGSIFIVDCIRIFLLEKGIDATTTIERLDKLVELNVFTRETAEHIRAAFEAFTYLRLRREIELVQQGKDASHYLDPELLSPAEQDLLREAFRVAGKVQDSAKRHFGQGAV
ncbi:MAG: cyclic nucleotide-binding protein [Desulfuromonas sp.]|nr:MAG: cyclic nucleotide-binding protein [Desulfuromonas sp.]